MPRVRAQLSDAAFGITVVMRILWCRQDLMLNSLVASDIQKTWIQVQVQVKLMTWGKSVPFPALLFSSVK